MGDIKSGLEIKKDPDRLSQLQYAAWIMFHLFTALPEGEIPQELQVLIGAMENKLQRTFSTHPHQLEPFVTEEVSHSSFLPNWPQRCYRCVYKRYLLKSGQNRQKGECTKDYRGHPRLMPGIFTLYCRHGIDFKQYPFGIVSNKQYILQ